MRGGILPPKVILMVKTLVFILGSLCCQVEEKSPYLLTARSCSRKIIRDGVVKPLSQRVKTPRLTANSARRLEHSTSPRRTQLCEEYYSTPESYLDNIQQLDPVHDGHDDVQED